MTLELVAAIAPLRARVTEMRRGGRIGFVPTMGALHAGHASLIERARRECGSVVVSIFVNPLQFDRPDDLERYPRPLEADLDLCRSLGVNVVFAPSVAEMYPAPPSCTIDPGPVAEHCCGRYRPGHFRGVATVVMKLLEIVRGDVAYFGEKDAQQLAVVRRLVRDFNVPVTIVGVPTVREADGVALSSRNRHLSAADRQLAPALYRALTEAAASIDVGVTDPDSIRARALGVIPASDRMRVEYLEIVDPEEFQPLNPVSKPAIVAGAVWIGGTRLIDNVKINPGSAR